MFPAADRGPVHAPRAVEDDEGPFCPFMRTNLGVAPNLAQSRRRAKGFSVVILCRPVEEFNLWHVHMMRGKPKPDMTATINCAFHPNWQSSQVLAHLSGVSFLQGLRIFGRDIGLLRQFGDPCPVRNRWQGPARKPPRGNDREDVIGKQFGPHVITMRPFRAVMGYLYRCRLGIFPAPVTDHRRPTQFRVWAVFKVCAKQDGHVTDLKQGGYERFVFTRD